MNSQFIDNKYWSENAPRVLVTGKYTKYLLQDIGMDKNDLHHIYGVNTELYSILKFFYNGLEFSDYFKVTSILFEYYFKKPI